VHFDDKKKQSLSQPLFSGAESAFFPSYVVKSAFLSGRSPYSPASYWTGGHSFQGDKE